MIDRDAYCSDSPTPNSRAAAGGEGEGGHTEDEEGEVIGAA
jgi:hypothetical protein